ncbi:hypothetical protein [Paenibacillus tarimensis]|uniref:hypothetical protein n=1 Tax=Paenibacillus tarimensis TaxID=416012 RepID=UPI001F2D5A72|nr:hypothetical protein [Paenibacillus tarimensis]MCF2942870.1 hypothetical protein [Paenibacillus tarimensis]
MKKFIAGVVVGGMLFGGVSVFAAELKNVIFNIDSVVVDGQSIGVQSKNKPFTFQNYGYFPSYMLYELGYKPSRSADGRTVYLESIGKNYYPLLSTAGGPAVDGRIPTQQLVNYYSTTKIGHEGSAPIKAPGGTEHFSYILTSLNKASDGTRPQTEITFQPDEKFVYFKATAALVTHETKNLPEGTVTLRVYVTSETGKEVLFSTHAVSASKKTAEVAVPLRYVSKIKFSVTGQPSEEAEFALLDPVFVK